MWAEKYGGFVMNAAINHFVHGTLTSDPDKGTKVEYHCELPTGSGLGTSAAMNVVLVTLLRTETDIEHTVAHEIAEQAYEFESLLGVRGGRQDQYAAAFGFFSALTFTSHVSRKFLIPDCNFERQLQERLVLCYTGKQRLSGNIHENVWGSLKRRNPRVVSAMRTLKSCGEEAFKSIQSGNIDSLGEVMNLNWEAQKRLDDSITNHDMEHIFKMAFASGAVSGKACGAGGGGCLLFLTEEGRTDEVRKVLFSAGYRILPFKFCPWGVSVEK